MANEKQEVAEIQVLTPEQIEQMPKEAKESVVFLQDNLGGAGLAKLNPLTTQLLEIKNIVSKLKYIPDDKDNKQTFVDAKKEIRNLRGKLTKQKKELKAPVTKLSKAIDTVFNTIKTEADNSYAEAEKIFAPLIEAEEKAKAEKTRLAEEAKNKAIQEANDKVTETQRLANRANKFTEIRYKTIGDKLGKQTMIDCQTFSLEATKNKIAQIEQLTFDSFLKLHNVEGLDILLDEQLSELKTEFANEKTFALQTYRQRENMLSQVADAQINAIKAETKAEVIQEQVNTPAPEPAPQTPTPPPAPVEVPSVNNVLEANETVKNNFPPAMSSVPQPPQQIEVVNAETEVPLSDQEFLDYIFQKTVDLNELMNVREIKNPEVLTKISKIKTMYGKMIGYCTTTLNLSINK